MSISGRIAVRVHPFLGDRWTLWLYATCTAIEAAYYQWRFRRVHLQTAAELSHSDRAMK